MKAINLIVFLFITVLFADERNDLSFYPIPLTPDSSSMAVVILRNSITIDTIELQGEPWDVDSIAIAFCDYNFDGYYDIIHPDISSASHGVFDHYFYIYKPDRDKFSNTPIVKRLAGFSVNTNGSFTAYGYIDYNGCSDTTTHFSADSIVVTESEECYETDTE